MSGFPSNMNRQTDKIKIPPAWAAGGGSNKLLLRVFQFIVGDIGNTESGFSKYVSIYLQLPQNREPLK